MVNFCPPNTVPEKFKDRKFYQHNPTVTLSPEPKNTKRLEIGSRLSGTIDGVRISSSARYDRDFVPESDWKADDATEALYLFNEGQGDVLKDLSRHGRPGRIKGAKWVRLEGRQPGNSNLQDGAQTPKPAVAPFDAAQARKYQEAWATYLNVPVEFTNSIGMKFRLIPPGEFTMGSTQAEIDLIKLQDIDKGIQAIHRQMLSNAIPPHRVSITRPFYIQTHEVSNGVYQRLLGELPELNDPQKPETTVLANVKLTDATRFCDALSRLEGKTPAFRMEGEIPQRILDADGYRLPTEAEWEYVCRAGTTALWNFGDDRQIASDPGILRETQTAHRGTAAVPNPFGIFDLYGGSSEWCFDRFVAYRPEATVDPFAQPRQGEGVIRGGSFFAGGGTDPIYNNSVTRERDTLHTLRYRGVGRVVLPIISKPMSVVDYGLERDCAEWLRSHDNAVEIRIGNQLKVIEHDQPLPSENFTLEKAARNFAGPETGAALQPRIEKFARLHRFEGGYLPSVASRQWAAAFAKMPNVLHINAFMTDIQDDDLALFAAMPNLQYLSVDGCQKLTGKGIRNLAASRSLRTINLWDTSKINNSYTLEDVQALQNALPLCTITKGSGEPIPGLMPAKSQGSGNLFMHDPAFRQWVKDVQAMPAEQQVEAVRKKLVELNPKFDGKLVTTRSGHGGPKIEAGKVTEFGFYTDEVTDISPVAALQDLTHLFCACNTYEMKGGRLKDLSPLRGLRLKSLDLFYNTTLSDLTPLQGMPLTSLVIAGAKPLTTLTPLEGMKLTDLNIAFTSIKDLTLLKGMPLTILHLMGTPVEDLTPLKGMPLKTLVIRESQVTDLSPIKGMELTLLDIHRCTRISDASPLRGMKLEILSCSETQFSDYSFLTGMPLKNVELNFKPDRDAKVLRSIKTLETINQKTAAEFWKEVDRK